MRRAARAALGAVLLLAGCGGTDFVGVGKIELGTVEVSAADPALAREAHRRLDAYNAGGTGLTKVTLTETYDRGIASRDSSGATEKWRLTYVLAYQVARDGLPPLEGTFRLNHAVDNDDTAHRAVTLEIDRFRATARRSAIASLLGELQLDALR